VRSHPDSFSFFEAPLPLLLLMRYHHMRFGEDNPSERKRVSYQRKERTLLAALTRPFPPIEPSCEVCGARGVYDGCREAS
jgi:hypothetical protein